MSCLFTPCLLSSVRSGNPLDRQSLHYIDPSGQAMNQYQGAISMVGEVLQFYDTDKRYPVYGFGGQFRTRKHTQPHIDINVAEIGF